MTQTATLDDRMAIVDLVSELGLWLDEQRWDDAHAIFTADATVETPGGTASGRDALVAQARRNHQNARTQHVITNCVIALDGDRATVRANLVVSFSSRDRVSAPHLQLGERYRFEAVRHGGGWRLCTVHVTPVWRAAPPATSG
jgi:hypothetical protein